jgi:hypothetical protein
MFCASERDMKAEPSGTLIDYFAYTFVIDLRI